MIKPIKHLLIVDATLLLQCLDEMEIDKRLPIIDVEACMSQFIETVSYKPKRSYLEQGIDTVFRDQNLNQTVFEDHPELFDGIYNKMYSGLCELVNVFNEHSCYTDTRDFKYDYWKRFGKKDIILRGKFLPP